MNAPCKTTEKVVMEGLKTIIDPEMRINIVDLGLIYGVDINAENNGAVVKMTLTSPGCPFGPEIVSAVEMILHSLRFEEKKVVLIWDPPWDPATMASEEVKDQMGIW